MEFTTRPLYSRHFAQRNCNQINLHARSQLDIFISEIGHNKREKINQTSKEGIFALMVRTPVVF